MPPFDFQNEVFALPGRPHRADELARAMRDAVLDAPGFRGGAIGVEPDFRGVWFDKRHKTWLIAENSGGRQQHPAGPNTQQSVHWSIE